MKKAFTLLELMVVLAIIGILLGIVVTVASNMIQTARDQKTEALCKVVQQGLETYRAQKDRWPGSVGDRIAQGQILSRSNEEGDDGRTDDDKYVLEAGEVRDMIKEIVLETVNNNNPMLDVSGLYVSRSPGEKGGRDYGLDFRDAILGHRKRSPNKMSVSEMHFGYPESSRGYFRRFKIIYSVPTDSIGVYKQ